MFHPQGIIGHHWSLLFNVYFHVYFFVYLFVYLESGGRFEFKIWISMKLNLSLIQNVFLKKCLGSPCYQVVVSGGSFFLGGLNKDTRRCFLWCLQVSSSLSLLFNIKITMRREISFKISSHKPKSTAVSIITDR